MLTIVHSPPAPRGDGLREKAHALRRRALHCAASLCRVTDPALGRRRPAPRRSLGGDMSSAPSNLLRSPTPHPGGSGSRRSPTCQRAQLEAGNLAPVADRSQAAAPHSARAPHACGRRRSRSGCSGRRCALHDSAYSSGGRLSPEATSSFHGTGTVGWLAIRGWIDSALSHCERLLVSPRG